MEFEFFTDSGRGFRPRVSIRKQGQIGLNQGAVRRFNLDSWEYVVLGFDRKCVRIALRRADSRDEPGAQRMLIKHGSATISARSFLEYFDIGYRDKTRQYDVSIDDENGMLIVALDKEDGDGAVAEQAQETQSA